MTEDESENDKQRYSEQEIRSALSRVDIETEGHGANYAAGMRLARHIVETELLGDGFESE